VCMVYRQQKIFTHDTHRGQDDWRIFVVNLDPWSGILLPIEDLRRYQGIMMGI